MATPSVSIPPYGIDVRSPSMVPVGRLGRITSLKVTPRFNAVGAFEMTLPFQDPKAQLLNKGCWVQFTSNDNVVLAGQIRGRKIIEDESNIGGTLTVYGPSAEQIIADHLAYQVPTSVATSQGADDYDNRTGAAESVIKAYVNMNAGPGALFARRSITPVSIEWDQGRGSTVKASARMDNLLELIAGLCTAGGLGFRVVFGSGNTLEFQVYAPVDRSGSAKFGAELGNLVSYEYTEEASTATAAVIGGGGDGISRTFREIVDTTAQTEWTHRTEVFLDQRDTTDAAELDQAGAAAVVEKGPVKGLAIKTADTPNLRFNREYYLGDRVSVPAAGITDILREVEIEWSADKGPSTSSTVGTASTTGSLKMLTLLDDLNYRVAALERTK